jgi:uncharacterized phiE125 gp8 family phage protein
MTLTIRTPPAEEPVSLAMAKQALRLAHGEEDGFIATLIAAARQAVEARAGLALVSRAARERLDAWRTKDGRAGLLSLGPVSAVDAVRITDAAGVRQVVDAARYALDGAADPPRLLFKDGLPMPARSLDGVEIDYVAGFGAPAVVPAALQEAVLLTVAAFYENRTGDRVLPPLAAGLIAPYSRVRL